MFIKTNHTKFLVLLVCAILGFMLAMQLKSTGRQKTVPVQRAEELTERLKSAEKDRERLTAEIESLKGGTAAFDKESQRLKTLAGETALVGKGVIVTIDDSTIPTTKPGSDTTNLYVIHDEDLLRVVNELRAAGAEAIAINGQRMTATSEIRCTGPTVVINETRLAAPFVIAAIGNPQTLESSLKIRGGVLENFKFWGIKADVKQSDQVQVPAVKQGHQFEYAKPAPKPENPAAGQEQGKTGTAVK
jgi:uncharacterized protein YlxW (UPF0749 family)